MGPYRIPLNQEEWENDLRYDGEEQWKSMKAGQANDQLDDEDKQEDREASVECERLESRSER